MLPDRLRPLRPAALVLLFGAAFLAPSCIEVESTTAFEPDGSGTVDVEFRVNLGMLEQMGEGAPSAADDDELAREFQSEIAAAADSTEGLRLDTAWVRTEGGVTRMHARLAFASVDVARRFGQAQGEGDGIGRPPLITHEEGRLTIVHPKGAAGDDPRAAQLGRMLAMGMISGRTRYVFPEGTDIVEASPAVTERADGTLVYEVGLAELMGTAGPDSLYVEADLPSGSPLGKLGLVALALLLLGGGVMALRRG